MRAVAITLLLSMAVMAGCVDSPKPATPQAVSSAVPSNLVKDGRDLRVDLKETDVIEAPQWKVGDWFGHHVFFEGGPAQGMHINTIVVKEQGDKWVLATDDKQMAKIESVFDIPIIGALKKSDLSGTGFGAPWEPYVFPLKQGATWTKKIQEGDLFGGGDEMTIKFEVAYNPRIETPDGLRPGFDIFGKTEEGKTLLQYDFVPDIQWYAHFYSFKLDTEQPDDFDFHVMSMGHGSSWTGTYYIDEAKPVIQAHHGMAAPEEPGQQPYADPMPYLTFNVDTKANYVYGFVFAVSYAGAQEVLVLDPKNEKHEYQAYGADYSENSGEVDLPVVAGEWKVVGVGAGVAAVWGVFLWQVTENAAMM